MGGGALNRSTYALCRRPHVSCCLRLLLSLGKQYLCGKRAVRAVAAQVASLTLHDGVHADQAEAVAAALGSEEEATHLLLLFCGGEIG